MKMKQFVSAFLAVAMILGCLGWGPASAQQTQTDATQNNVLSSAQPDDLTKDSQILDYVDPEQFYSAEHIARLPGEETLDSYVFLNSDGSKSIYYMGRPVKYIDENGTIREKDITLVRKNNGYGMRDNDVTLYIPDAAATGVMLSHNDFAVRLTPQGGSGMAQQEENSIVYANYFGWGTFLRYTPMLSGMKEDIILAKYTGQNSFTFLLETNGLYLYQNEGSYYLAENQDAEAAFYLGQIEVYDAIGRPDLGTMTAETLVSGQRYRLTVSVDQAFLTDPETVYPVTIDPTLTVRDSADVTNTLADTPVFSNRPNKNYGDYRYDSIGYVEGYGTAMTAVRLTSLLADTNYSQLTADQLTNVTFYIKGAGGQYANISAHALTENSTWTELGLTWNTLGAYSTNAYATVLMGGSSWNAFDLTDLAKEWKAGTQNPQCGFVLISDSSTIATSAYGGENPTVDYRPYVVATYTNQIILNQSSASIYDGDILALTATTIPAGQAVTWESENSDIAALMSNGAVYGVSGGTTKIIASLADGTTAECVVTVTDRVISFDHYDDISLQVYKGNSITLTPYVVPEGDVISWHSMTPEIATVSDDGVVTGVAPGNAVIRAFLCTGAFADCQVEVLSTSISFDCPCDGDCSTDCTCGCVSVINLYLEESVTLTATTEPPGLPVDWESENPSVATVVEGVVTGVGVGETIIRAYLDAETFVECVVTVSAWNILLDYFNISITEGNTVSITATIASPNQLVEWESSDATVASVTQSGVVTALKAGDAIITATLSNGMSASCAVTVQCVASLGSSFISLDQYEHKQLVLEGLPENAEITWESSNPDVVAVSSDGYIYGVRAGYAYITADSKYLTDPTSLYIHVSLADGIYYIQSNGGFMVGAPGYPDEGDYLSTYVHQNVGNAQLYQLWYIKELSCCWYLISPVCDTSLCMGIINNNVSLTSDLTLWNISYESNGYVIRTGDSYEYNMQVVTPGSYPGCSIHADEISTGSTLHYWHFENAEGLFLIDADTGASLTDSAVFSIDVGDTADVDSLGLIISNEGSWGSTLFWSSSDTSVATVDPYTGTVYGLKRGKCTITATQTINDLVYERKYTLRVLEVIYVQNFYDTTITSGILELIDDSVNFLNDVYISVNLRFEMAGEPLPNPFDPTNNEPCLSDPCTEGFGTGAWLEHHKDVYLIAKKFTKEYYERNHVIVTWSDCWSAQSKFTYCYHDSRTDCHSHSLLNAYGYTVNCPGSEPKKFFPVAQILTITKYKDDGTITYETSKYMKLVLAHEIAHVLGLDEIYSKRYEDCDDETVDKHKYASVDCVMAKLSGDISSFVDAVEEKNAAFCPYCQRKIEELISDRDLFVDGEFDSFLTN